MSKLFCDQCGCQMFTNGWTSTTLVAFMSEPGHDHDDNCHTRTYKCGNGHEMVVSVENSCYNPECDWMGKTECFCCGTKLREWPEG